MTDVPPHVADNDPFATVRARLGRAFSTAARLVYVSHGVRPRVTSEIECYGCSELENEEIQRRC
jgi:hypothetical protein